MGFADKFLFGSAYPLTAIGPFVENFMKIGWRPELAEKLLYRNAITALKLDQDPVFVDLYKLGG